MDYVEIWDTKHVVQTCGSNTWFKHVVQTRGSNTWFKNVVQRMVYCHQNRPSFSEWLPRDGEGNKHFQHSLPSLSYPCLSLSMYRPVPFPGAGWLDRMAMKPDATLTMADGTTYPSAYAAILDNDPLGNPCRNFNAWVNAIFFSNNVAAWFILALKAHGRASRTT